jgi:hypothetical protein
MACLGCDAAGAIAPLGCERDCDVALTAHALDSSGYEPDRETSWGGDPR